MDHTYDCILRSILGVPLFVKLLCRFRDAGFSGSGSRGLFWVQGFKVQTP